jgi:hypothetical protein
MNMLLMVPLAPVAFLVFMVVMERLEAAIIPSRVPSSRAPTVRAGPIGENEPA